MCGIFFSLSTSGFVHPIEETCGLLRQRGPDSFRVHSVQRDDPKDESQRSSRIGSAHLIFASTVLSLRGDRVHAQPLVDETSKSVLCWNGEAWKVAGQPVQDNDTELIFQLFLQAVQLPYSASGATDTTVADHGNGDDEDAVQRVADVISSISGPFAFVFYDAFHSRVFFGRDCLGRRSLLQGLDETGCLKICSLCDGSSSTPFEEVGTEGMYMIDLVDIIPGTKCNIQTLPWTYGETIPSHHLVR